MPLHLICECCKRKKYITKDIWLISKNHSLSNSIFLNFKFNKFILKEF